MGNESGWRGMCYRRGGYKTRLKAFLSSAFFEAPVYSYRQASARLRSCSPELSPVSARPRNICTALRLLSIVNLLFQILTFTPSFLSSCLTFFTVYSL